MAGHRYYLRVTLSVIFVLTFLCLQFPGRVEGMASAPQNAPSGAQPRIKHVIRPTLGCPSFVLAGSQLKVDVSLGMTLPDHPYRFKAFITTSNDPIPMTLGLEFESMEAKGGGVVTLAFRVPGDAPEDLYDLEVVLESQDGVLLRDGQPHAVKVLRHLDDDLILVHFTDTQIGDLLSAANNPSESLPNWITSAPFKDHWKYLHRAIDIINLIKPDLVILTGDLVYGQLYFGEYPREYDFIYRYLLRFDVPVFVAPGNHDSYRQAEDDGKEYFRSLLGPTQYSFDYGPIRFVAVDTYDWPEIDRSGYGLLVSTWGGQVSRRQLRWLEEELRAHAQSAMRVIFCHHSPDDTSEWPLWAWRICLAAAYPFPQLYLRFLFGLLYDQEWVGEGRREFLSLLERGKVDLLLAGHVHHDRVSRDINRYGTDVVTTTSASFNVKPGKAYPGFRVVTIRDGVVVDYGYMGDWSHPIYSNGFPPSANLAQQFEPALYATISDGSGGEVPSKELLVVNRYLEPVPVNAEFVLPAGREYRVSGGEVWQISPRGDWTVLYVRSQVDATSTLKVSVHSVKSP